MLRVSSSSIIEKLSPASATAALRTANIVCNADLCAFETRAVFSPLHDLTNLRNGVKSLHHQK